MIEKATFGAGCFWGVEYLFAQQVGVVHTSVGYMGGDGESPTYHQVCTGTTGHAEVVHMKYDSEQISYIDLLDLFWANHDPTTLNRQGPDHGTQYRSVVFYHSLAQADTAQSALTRRKASGHYTRPIITAIEPAKAYWLAEDYHQQYVAKRKQCSV